MANIRNTMTSPQAARSGETAQEVRDRWAGEVSTNGAAPTPMWGSPWTAEDTRFGRPAADGQMNRPGQMNGGYRSGDWMMEAGMQQMNGGGQMPRSTGLNMQNHLPSEIIESPTTVNEAYLGSLKATLLRNKGNFIVATFLVGTQNLMTWEGVLYEVGNDYVTIYQPARDRYVVIDMYSLKYMEFYDTRQRELCDRLLREQGMPGMQNTW